tara:strand:+ start:1802 stop:2380 length:579 start_codon:yes stop_codon:yes gene_type:complete
MKKIIIIGAGGHCKVCIDVIEQIGKWKIIGIVDQKKTKTKNILGYPIIGFDRDLEKLQKKYKYAFLGVGQIYNTKTKVKLFNQLIKFGYKLPCLISPNAYVSKYAKIGKGTIIMNNATVNADAKIGDNCIINSKSLIEHDALIENHCHVSTGATINGGVKVGSQSFIGSNATTKEKIIIASKSFIKANTVVK